VCLVGVLLHTMRRNQYTEQNTNGGCGNAHSFQLHPDVRDATQEKKKDEGLKKEREIDGKNRKDRIRIIIIIHLQLAETAILR